MTDDPRPKIILTREFCRKRDSQMRKIVEENRWEGGKHTMCNEYLFICSRRVMHKDRGWCERSSVTIMAAQVN